MFERFSLSRLRPSENARRRINKALLSATTAGAAGVIATTLVACGHSSDTVTPTPSPTSTTQGPSPTNAYPLETHGPLAPAALPFHTSGSQILDRNGKPVILRGVNWPGAESQGVPAGLKEQKLSTIVSTFQREGFNYIRLPWSNVLWEQNPVVPKQYVADNPQLFGLHYRDALSQVVNAITADNMLVLPDDHMINPGWCCNNNDGNGLWWNGQVSEQQWISDWQSFANWFGPHGKDPQPGVFGVELKNEIRTNNAIGTPTWTNADPALSWSQAATIAGNAVLKENPKLLVFVGGPNYDTTLAPFKETPIHFLIPNRLVLTIHLYSWDGKYAKENASQLEADYYKNFGYLLQKGMPYTTPVDVTEFGTNGSVSSQISSSTVGTVGYWFKATLQYLDKEAPNGLGWAEWSGWGGKAGSGIAPAPPTGPGIPRIAEGTPETFSPNNNNGSGPRLNEFGQPELLALIQSIIPGGTLGSPFAAAAMTPAQIWSSVYTPGQKSG
jgi:endoglucanase